MQYLTFAGTIPEGQYGAGTVEIWDKGYYALVEQSDSKVWVILMGTRLRGAYKLVHTRENQWLLWKHLNEDEGANR